MRRLIASLFLLMSATLAAAQVPFPQTLPPGTVYGRMPPQAGPGQAIPFAILNGNIASAIFGFTSNGNSNFVIPATARTVVTTAAFTAPRTWTLPLASLVTPGQLVCVVDQAGGLTAVNTLTITRAGSDTINGGTSAVLNTAFSGTCFVGDGSSKWTTYLGTNLFTQTGTGAVQQSIDARIKLDAVHLKDFSGATADAVAISTGTVSITSGAGALTATAATFTSADVGKIIRVDGAGTTNSQYFGTITVFTDATHVTVSPNASTTMAAVALSGTQQVVYGTDNATALQNWINRCQIALQVCELDGGSYAFGSALSITNTLAIRGQGRQSSILYPLNPSITQLQINTNNPVSLRSFAMWAARITGITTTMLSITGPQQNYGTILEDLYWIGGNTMLACTNCQNLRIDKVQFIDAINNGIILGNAAQPLAGQYFISNSEFALRQTASVRQTCITLQSGGNFALVNSMVHFCNVAINVQENAGTLIGDVFITGNSIEQNDSTGITFNKGTATTVQSINIVSNDIAGGTPNGITCTGGTAFVQDMSIIGNSIYPNGGTGIALDNACSLADGSIVINSNNFAQGGGTTTGINVSGNAVKGMAAGNTFRGLTTNVANSSPFFLMENLVNGHTNYVGVAPTLTAGCNGAGQVTTGATDKSGTITGQTTAHTTCTLTFAQAYGTAPNCTATGLTSPLTGAVAITTTTLQVNFANTANFKWTYSCSGN